MLRCTPPSHPTISLSHAPVPVTCTSPTSPIFISPLPPRCLLQVLYNLLSFYMLMPFVFMSLFWGDKRFYMADVAGDGG